LQRLEQHCVLLVHALPSVEQAALSAAHLPATQLWLQQSPPTLHGPVSEVHAGYPHAPPVQSPLQQSPLAVHDDPSFKHATPAPPPAKSPGVRPPSPDGWTGRPPTPASATSAR
jgi:hypothetical protein